jgi:Ni,Fe-hydrogenase III small subunit/ferredoxin
MWVFRGLRAGVVTTRWPDRPDSYAERLRGPARVLEPSPAAAADLARLCPAGAISHRGDEGVRLDQGACIQCGRCVAERPDVFGWAEGPGPVSLSRGGLVVPQVSQTAQNLARIRADLRQRARALRRSVHIRHVDAGSDGAEEWEVLALLNPVYDVHRLGIFFTASPRHADVLLVTGAGAAGMVAPLRRTYAAMPEPKLVIAAGTDAISGGLLGASSGAATHGGVGDLIPVDVWVPGSPPSPFSLLYALLLALGRVTAGAEGATVPR